MIKPKKVEKGYEYKGLKLGQEVIVKSNGNKCEIIGFDLTFENEEIIAIDRYGAQYGIQNSACSEVVYYKDTDSFDWIKIEDILMPKENPNIKDLLKTGMIVETRDGRRYQVLSGDLHNRMHGSQNIIFQRNEGFMLGSSYNDNLVNIIKSTKELDISKIYHNNDISALKYIDIIDDLELIWERKEETKNITITSDTGEKISIPTEIAKELGFNILEQ